MAKKLIIPEEVQTEVQDIEVQDIEVQTEVQIEENVLTYSEKVELLKKENNLHLVSNNVLLSAHAVKAATKDKKGFYTQIALQLAQPVRYFKEAQDGKIVLSLLSVVQVSVYSLLAAIRKEIYFVPIVSRLAADFAEDAEANQDPGDELNIYTTDDYFSGIPIQIFCQYVDAGEVAANPFRVDAEPYEVKAHPRYIYHIIKVGKPVDAESLENIKQIKAEIRAENIALRDARKKAKAQALSVLSSIDTSEVIPF